MRPTIAGALHLPFRIGCAGWSNPPVHKHSRKPHQSHLEFYASRFNCVEVNSSFYRSHMLGTYRRWRATTPSSFVFSVKVPRSVTHESALRHCQGELARFLGEVRGLGNKLRVLLVQLPPSLEFDPRVVRTFFASLHSETDAAVACECRHASWFTNSANLLLRKLEVARVAADPPRGAQGDEPGGSGRLAYYRLHGSPRIYYSGYNGTFIHDLAQKLALKAAEAGEVWCIFDNTAEYHAWPDALRLSKSVAESE